MKIGMKLILILSAVNLVGFGGLTLSLLLFSSSAISSLADQNAANITSVTAGAVKAYLEIPHGNQFSNIRENINPPLQEMNQGSRQFVRFWCLEIGLLHS